MLKSSDGLPSSSYIFSRTTSIFKAKWNIFFVITIIYQNIDDWLNIIEKSKN